MIYPIRTKNIFLMNCAVLVGSISPGSDPWLNSKFIEMGTSTDSDSVSDSVLSLDDLTDEVAWEIGRKPGSEKKNWLSPCDCQTCY